MTTGSGRSNDGACFWCECWWRMGDFEAIAARSVDIPIASYCDAVWPDIDNPLLDLPFFWNCLSHPDRVAHELVSDVVKNALEQLFISSVQDIKNPKVDLSIESASNLYLSDCASHSSQNYFSTIIGVQDLAKFTSTAISAGSAWRVYEDRPQKPGWIASWTQNNYRTRAKSNLDQRINPCHCHSILFSYLILAFR
jgi:hypothetical protein